MIRFTTEPVRDEFIIASPDWVQALKEKFAAGRLERIYDFGVGSIRIIESGFLEPGTAIGVGHRLVKLLKELEEA